MVNSFFSFKFNSLVNSKGVFKFNFLVSLGLGLVGIFIFVGFYTFVM